MTIETCVARVFRIDNIRSEHFIVGVYRPHTDSIDNFVHALQEILSNHILHNKTVILAGDMNINLLDLNNIHVDQYLCMLNSLNYIQTINKATRFPYGNNPIYNPSCLDHIFINKFTSFNASIYFADISDHCGTSLYLEMDATLPESNIKHTCKLDLGTSNINWR